MGEITLNTASVVMLGNFNPTIFQPEWLRAHRIIGETESEEASRSIEVIHPDVCMLNLTHMKLVVEPGKFSLTATDEPLVRAKDFVLGCFNVLQHTPVNAVGLNRDIVIRAPNLDSWNKFGDHL